MSISTDSREMAIKILIRRGVPGRYAEEAVDDADANPGHDQLPWGNVKIIRKGKKYVIGKR